MTILNPHFITIEKPMRMTYLRVRSEGCCHCLPIVPGLWSATSVISFSSSLMTSRGNGKVVLFWGFLLDFRIDLKIHIYTCIMSRGGKLGDVFHHKTGQQKGIPFTDAFTQKMTTLIEIQCFDALLM